MNKQVILGLLFSKDAEGQKSVEKISKKQITLIYVGILIYMLVSSLVEDGLKRIPDIHWIVAGGCTDRGWIPCAETVCTQRI